MEIRKQKTKRALAQTDVIVVSECTVIVLYKLYIHSLIKKKKVYKYGREVEECIIKWSNKFYEIN